MPWQDGHWIAKQDAEYPWAENHALFNRQHRESSAVGPFGSYHRGGRWSVVGRTEWLFGGV
jgi:hypothetical protein